MLPRSLIKSLSFNYRLIVLNIVIYDLITWQIASTHAFDHVSSSMTSLKSTQISTSSSFISGVDSAHGIKADSTLTNNTRNNNATHNAAHNDCASVSAAHVNIDSFQSENQTAIVTKPTKPTKGAGPSLDLLSTAWTKNSSMTMSTEMSFPLAKRLSTYSTQSSSSSLSSSSLSALRSPLHSQFQLVLSRPKRYLAFPEGSSFTVAICFTVGIIGNPRYNYMSFGLNWGVAYDLPNTSWVLNHLHGFSKHPVPWSALKRRSRRSLYNEIEMVVNNMGYNGRDCVLRALCESRQYFQKPKLSMVGEMLRVLFSLPKQRLFTRELHENPDIELYDHAYRGSRSVDCAELFDCSFSLLELAFGKYSKPPPGYYGQQTGS